MIAVMPGQILLWLNRRDRTDSYFDGSYSVRYRQTDRLHGNKVNHLSGQRFVNTDGNIYPQRFSRQFSLDILNFKTTVEMNKYTLLGCEARIQPNALLLI